MNILFIADDFPPYNKGGAGISTSLLVKYISRKHKCFVLTTKNERNNWHFNGVPVYSVLKKAESRNSNVHEVLFFGFNIIAKVIYDYRYIHKFIKNNDIDLINIVATNYISALQISSLSLLGVNIAVDARDLSLFHTISYLQKFREPNSNKRTFLLRLFLKLFLYFESIFFYFETSLLKLITKHGSTKIYFIAISEYVKNCLISFGYPKNKITVIHNISEKLTYNKSNKKRINQIVFAGRIESEKGIWVILSAWRLINLPNLRLLIIGDGSKLSDLKNYAIENKIKNVIFSGRLSSQEVKKEYQRSKIIIAPSIWPEPFGRFIQESIACKTPLISTKVGGIPEGIINNETGILIKPNNPKELAESIMKLLSDNKLYANIVKNLTLRKDIYSHEKIINERLILYERLAKK